MHMLRSLYHLTLSTCQEGIRHKALWAIVCLAMLLTLGNLGVTLLFTWDLGKVSIEFGLSAVAFTGLGDSVFPRPRRVSGRETTTAISKPAVEPWGCWSPATPPTWIRPNSAARWVKA